MLWLLIIDIWFLMDNCLNRNFTYFYVVFGKHMEEFYSIHFQLKFCDNSPKHSSFKQTNTVRFEPISEMIIETHDSSWSWLHLSFVTLHLLSSVQEGKQQNL